MAEAGAHNAAAETSAPATASTSPGRREWRVIAETVPGASHRRAGIPNQDAVLQVRESSVDLPLVVSLSDGHGSDKCFRSDRGSRFAVVIGASLLFDLVTAKRQDEEAALLEKEVRETLPAEFTRRWLEAVTADLGREPLSEEELIRLEGKSGEHARRTVEAHPPLAYGATTLTVALTRSFVIYLQLGDGEIFVVSEAGEVRRPLPEDQRLLANETTSLCLNGAAQDFRGLYQPLSESLPALILLTTDGYANSFLDDAGFLKVGSDILDMLRTDGFDTVNQSVKGWLEEATRSGSGDDCTVGLICRMDALQGRPPADAQVRDETGSQPVVHQGESQVGPGVKVGVPAPDSDAPAAGSGE